MQSHNNYIQLQKALIPLAVNQKILVTTVTTQWQHPQQTLVFADRMIAFSALLFERQEKHPDAL